MTLTICFDDGSFTLWINGTKYTNSDFNKKNIMEEKENHILLLWLLLLILFIIIPLIIFIIFSKRRKERKRELYNEVGLSPIIQ